MNDILEIYLPASAPDNFKYGRVPTVPAIPGSTVFYVSFPEEVWYNREWRARTVKQFKPALSRINVLIGFSKSGCGALNIAIENPEIFHAVIIFDSPLMHKTPLAWNASSFYSQAAWEDDLPENRLAAIKSLSLNTKIIHIGGESFYQDHLDFSKLLRRHDIKNDFLPGPVFSHSWESGWLPGAAGLAI